MMKMIMKPSKMGDLGPSNGNVLTILKAVQQKNCFRIFLNTRYNQNQRTAWDIE